MEAKELRINNLVLNNEGKISKIAEISEIGTVLLYNLEFWNTDTKFGQHCNEISGIPLTEEWLVKLGFEKWNEPSKNLHIDAWQIPKSARFDIDWIEGKLYLKSRYDQENLPAQWMPQIKFVHQLQNLYFALTQTELNTEKI